MSSAREMAAQNAYGWATRAEQREHDRREFHAALTVALADGRLGDAEKAETSHSAAETERDRAVAMAHMWAAVAAVQPQPPVGHCGSVIDAVSLGPDGPRPYTCAFAEGHSGMHGYDSRAYGYDDEVLIWSDNADGVHRLDEENL